MIEFVCRYWIEELFAAIIALVTWLVRQTKVKKKEYKVLKEGILALLHDRLYMACSFFLNRGYCTVDDRENLECMFRPYKDLGGNGTGEDLFNKCMKLPLKQGSNNQ